MSLTHSNVESGMWWTDPGDLTTLATLGTLGTLVQSHTLVLIRQQHLIATEERSEIVITGNFHFQGPCRRPECRSYSYIRQYVV